MTQSYALERLSAFSFHSKVDKSSLLSFELIYPVKPLLSLCTENWHIKKAFLFLLELLPFSFKDHEWVGDVFCGLTIILIKAVQAVCSRARYQNYIWNKTKDPNKITWPKTKWKAKLPQQLYPVLISYASHIISVSEVKAYLQQTQLGMQYKSNR